MDMDMDEPQQRGGRGIVLFGSWIRTGFRTPRIGGRWKKAPMPWAAPGAPEGSREGEWGMEERRRARGDEALAVMLVMAVMTFMVVPPCLVSC